MESGIYRDNTGKLDRLSPNANNTNNVFNVNGNTGNAGNVNNNNVNNNNSFAPVLYLTSDITLTGSGEVDNPYVIG